MFSSSDLTLRQAEIFDYLREFRLEEGISPSYREIAGHFGFKSTKAVADHIAALEKKGYVRRHKGRSRGIELLVPDSEQTPQAVVVPILGAIPAGQPELKAEDPAGSLLVDPALLGNSVRHRLFALQVDGDSMQGRGVRDGDWVIADADLKAVENDMVVALVDGQNTLKTLAQKKAQFYLKAENPRYTDWIPLAELIIQGVAKAVVRRIP